VQKKPEGHAVQAIAPVIAMNVPARQLEQLVEYEDVEYDPAKQLEQTEDEATEYKPAAQAPVTDVSPVDAQYEPAGHVVHDMEPVDA